MFHFVKEYVWLPENLKKYRSVFAVFSVLWITVCLLLMIPQIRGGILFSIERWILNRPLGDPLRWNQTLLLYGLNGIITPALFFSCVILFIRCRNFFGNEKIIKIICCGSIILVTVSMIWLIMYRNAWILSDDHIFLRTTAINTYLPLDFEIYGGGRFFPLGHYHYNILLPISYLFQWQEIPASALFALNAVLYAVSVLFMYLLFRDIEPIKNRTRSYIHALFVCLVPLFSSACVMIFMQCIFPETILTVMLAGFMLCYYRAFKTNKGVYYGVALFFALYSTYCKEPVFGVYVIIAVSNFIFGYQRQTTKGRFFYIALIANAVLFVVLYYLLSYSKAESLYNEGRVEQSVIKSLVIIFIQNKLFLVMVPFCIIRLFFVLVKKDRSHLYYDSLLFAGIGYIVAYVILHLNASYYFFPAFMLFLPSFVYWSKYLYSNKNKIYLVLFLAPTLLISGLNFGEEILSAKDIIFQRKNSMPFINDLLVNHENSKRILWYELDDQNEENTFYITVRNWQKYIINAFMSYAAKTDREYLLVAKNIEQLDKIDIFLYPKVNNHYRPIAEDMLMLLKDKGFELDMDFFNIYVYKYAGE